jgi:hypothetical protein
MRKSWIRRTLAALLLSIAADSAQAQLSLSLAANPDPALPDEPIAVAMTVSNAGAAAADVSLSFIVPAAFQTLPEATVSEPVTCNGVAFTTGSCAATETFTWNVGPLAAGEGRTLRFTPIVAAAATGIDFAVDLFQGGCPFSRSRRGSRSRSSPPVGSSSTWPRPTIPPAPGRCSPTC